MKKSKTFKAKINNILGAKSITRTVSNYDERSSHSSPYSSEDNKIVLKNIKTQKTAKFSSSKTKSSVSLAASETPLRRFETIKALENSEVEIVKALDGETSP